MTEEAWIIDAVRSPRGKGKETGALHKVHPQRILAQVLNELQRRNGFDTAEVDDVVMGCGAGSGDHSMDIARMATLDAGWSTQAPGVTLNRFCGSGQQAVTFARMGILNAAAGKTLPVYGKGENIRDWLYVDDHARALRLVLEKGQVGETYNIGGHNERSNIDVVRGICA